MKKSLAISVIVFLISISSTLAQGNYRDGYVVTHQGDTLSGMVDYRSISKNTKSCVFKKGDNVTTYVPGEIKGFGYRDDKYFTSEITDTTFLEVLIKGKLSLYKSPKTYFVQKGQEKVYELAEKKTEVMVGARIIVKEDNSWKGVLSYLTSDSQAQNSTTTNNLEFNEKSISKVVLRYNICQEADMIVYKQNKPWTKLSLGASVGGARSEFNVSNANNIEFDHLKDTYTSVNPSFGLILDVSFPRMNENISFQGEAHFFNSNYESLVQFNRGGRVEVHETHIELSTLSIPLSLKYTHSKQKFSPFVQGGASCDFNIKRDVRLLSESIEGENVMIAPETKPLTVARAQVGYWGGIGVERKVSFCYAALALRYTQLTGFSMNTGLETSQNRWALHLILSR